MKRENNGGARRDRFDRESQRWNVIPRQVISTIQRGGGKFLRYRHTPYEGTMTIA